MVSRKLKGKGKSGVWPAAAWPEWNAKRESHTNPKKTRQPCQVPLRMKVHRTSLEVMLVDGATETKSKPTAQVQALEKARDALRNCPELEGQED